MSRRGDDLRRHILWTAKQVFLEMGFERASMDEVAARAETSKRSLYAHFGSKENIFLEVVGLVRELYLEKLGEPHDYAEDPAEALAAFLARVTNQVLWESVIRTCRMAIAEADRLPDAARGYHAVVFDTPIDRIADFLVAAPQDWELGAARAAAHELLALVLYPRFIAALYGAADPIPSRPDGGPPDGVIDPAPILGVVTAVLNRQPARA